MTKICCECGSSYESGVCENCGVVDEDYKEYDYGNSYPFDREDESFSYGGARTHGISDISVMTKVNKSECASPDLKRALRWDGNYKWKTIKTEIVNGEIRRICGDLKLSKEFVERCFYKFRQIREKLILSGKKLEDVAAAVVYLTIRLDELPYTLFDFKTDVREFDDERVKNAYNIYVFLIKKLKLFGRIKPQDPRLFASKIINVLIPEDPKTYEYKRALVLHVIRLITGIYAAKSPHPAVDISLRSGCGITTVGALIYGAAKFLPEITVTQEVIANLCGCSKVTLREYYKKVEKYFKTYESL